ncbi:hypothetical protein HK097_008391 [Rhizophlyctis rosea]|uniref:TmcB/TmcC TPR repeats domain-containing protein n=1 Tax=Rhizophlyctis rosea TaxID=64517 RepID=A0AAD5X5B2_9FUNG|nr:hypothetical protein HK097_008391 [Rhizophlyctis rosea]
MSRTILVFMGYFARMKNQLIIELVFLLFIIVLHVHYEPYFDERVNNFRIAFFTLPFLSILVGTICWFSGLSESETSWAPVALLIATIPVGLIGGWILAVFVRRQKVRRIMLNIQNKYQVGAKDIEDGTAQPDKKILRSVMVNGNALNGKTSRRGSRRRSVFGQTLALATGEDSKEFVEDIETVAAAMMERYGQAVSKKAVRLPSVFRHSSEADLAMRFLRDSEASAAAIQIMHIVFKEAMEQFPKNAQLNLMYSFYLAAWTSDTESTIQYLTAAKSYKPAIDVRFRIFMEERDFEQGQHAHDLAASSLNVATYVEVQSMERQAVESHLESLHAMKAFWNYLAQDSMDPSVLPSYLALMHRTQDSAQKFYEKLVARYPRSKNTLRMYAKYLMVVVNNIELGQELLNRADEIEAQEARDIRERAASLPTASLHPSGMPGEDQPTLSAASSILSGSSSSIMGMPETIPEEPRVVNGASTMEQLPMDNSMSGFRRPDMSTEMMPQKRGSMKQGTETAGMRRPPTSPPQEELNLDDINVIGSGEGVQFVHKAKSIASSNTSRKEFRRLKARQARLKDNLLAPVTKFSYYVRAACLIILGLLIANFQVSQGLFDAPSTFLESLLTTTRMRRNVILLAQQFRMASWWAQLGEQAAWQNQISVATTNADRQATYLPQLFQYNDDVDAAQILQPQRHGFDAPKQVVTTNYYDLARIATESGHNLCEYAWEVWSQPDFLQNKYLRFWLTNALRIGDAFNQLCTAALNSFLDSTKSRNALVIVLMMLMIFGICMAGAFIHLTLRHGRRKQLIVLKTLSKVPGSDRRRIVADLEEEIEGLFEIEDNAERRDAMKHPSVEQKGFLRSHTVLYLVALMFLAGLALSQFVPPLLSMQYSEKAARLVMASNERRYHFQAVLYLSHELPAQDATIWGQYEVQDQLTLRIHALEDLVLSGIDNMLDVFIEHATAFLVSSDHTYNSPDLYFMQNLESDLAEGLRTVDNVIIQIERDRSANFIQIGTVLFSVCIAYFVAFYILVFYLIISAARTQMAMIVTVLFWIPNEVALKSAEIQKYLVSGSVEATEE